MNYIKKGMWIKMNKEEIIKYCLSLENTYKKRPELLKNKKLSLEDKEFLCKFK